MIGIRLERVSKKFAAPGHDGVAAIVEMSLSISPQEFVMIVGPNGSGKSTLLNLVAGALRPDHGALIARLADGVEQNWTRSSLRARGRLIGRIYQDPAAGTANGMTVAEHICLATDPGFTNPFGHAVAPRARAAIGQALASTGLGGKEDALADELSHGQRQLLTLEMAARRGAKLLLLDEPTASLDRRNAALCIERIGQLRTEFGPTILMATHDMALAARFGDRLLVLGDGRLRDDISGEDKSRLMPEDVFRLCGFEAVETEDQSAGTS